MKFFSLICVVAFMHFAAPALAGSKEACDSPQCRCYLYGECGKVAGPAKCVIAIQGPTNGGQLYVDILDGKGKSILPSGMPRSKAVAYGTFTYRVGCHWLKKAALVYVCVDGRKGGDGEQYWSKRFKPALDHALKTGVLEVCLLGPGCPLYRGSALAPTPEEGKTPAVEAPSIEQGVEVPEQSVPLPRSRPLPSAPVVPPRQI